MITMFAACCLLLPGTSGAQGPVPAPVAAVASDPVEAPKLLSFSFAGGTLREFAAALRTAAPAANVLLAQGAADVSVQAFELRNVELQQVLRVACELAAPDSVVSFRSASSRSLSCFSESSSIWSEPFPFREQYKSCMAFSRSAHCLRRRLFSPAFISSSSSMSSRRSCCMLYSVCRCSCSRSFCSIIFLMRLISISRMSISF